ncbi:MAG: TetR/AcrR family transcriptional regulator [Victivallales bacterium]|nr:TetR/AcrR family transcriptional regulator [Victivallales bacterium]
MDLTARQQEIINVSVSLIADKGIQNLTIKNIAQTIGISEPAIYRHFKNKFEILMTILDSFELIATDVLNSEEIKDLSSLDKIEFFLLDRYRRCVENPNLSKLMFAEENFQDDEQLSKKVLNIMHSHKDEMHKVISAGQKLGEIRDDIDSIALFRIIFGPMRLLIKQWGLSGCRFDLLEEGKKLWEAEKKILK